MNSYVPFAKSHEYPLTTGEPMPTSTNNPYERRARRDERLRHIGDAVTHGMPMMSMGGEAGPQFGLAIEDLDVLARSAHARGEARASARLSEHHAVEMLTAQRIAWERGHELGVVDGHEELIKAFTDRFGDAITKRIALVDEVLGALAKGDRKVTKDVLAGHLEATRAALAEIREARDIGFGTIPF